MQASLKNSLEDGIMKTNYYKFLVVSTNGIRLYGIKRSGWSINRMAAFVKKELLNLSGYEFEFLKVYSVDVEEWEEYIQTGWVWFPDWKERQYVDSVCRSSVN